MALPIVYHPDCVAPLPDGLDDDGYLPTLARVRPGLLARVEPDRVLYWSVNSEMRDVVGL